MQSTQQRSDKMPSKLANGATFGAELLKHLGIPEDGMKGFTIRVYANEVVTITVERLLKREDESVLCSVFEDYAVVNKDA